MKTQQCKKCSAFFPFGDSACPSCRYTGGAMIDRFKRPLQIAVLFAVVFLFIFWIFGGFEPRAHDRQPSESKVIASAFSSVRQMLKDPDSAKFGTVTRYTSVDGADLACGTVNSKNGFGGYPGAKRFIYKHDHLTVVFDDGGVDFSSAWNSLCR